MKLFYLVLIIEPVHTRKKNNRDSKKALLKVKKKTWKRKSKDSKKGVSFKERKHDEIGGVLVPELCCG